MNNPYNLTNSELQALQDNPDLFNKIKQFDSSPLSPNSPFYSLNKPGSSYVQSEENKDALINAIAGFGLSAQGLVNDFNHFKIQEKIRKEEEKKEKERITQEIKRRAEVEGKIAKTAKETGDYNFYNPSVWGIAKASKGSKIKKFEEGGSNPDPYITGDTSLFGKPEGERAPGFWGNFFNTKDGSKIPRGFGQKMGNPTLGNMMNATGNLATAISTSTGGFNMYEGPKGSLVQAIDQGWDTVSDTVSQFGPWGKMAGGIMKGMSMLNKVQNSLLGSKGTDNMTTQDAILNSPVGMLVPGLGLINALTGKNADTITKDTESFSTVGSSYAGTGNVVDDALTKSGKRYGGFSGKARQQANDEIAEATRQQNIMAGIADESTARSTLQSTMTNINATANAFAGAGGYQQANIRAAKYGTRLDRVQNIVNNALNKKVEQSVSKNFELFKSGGILIPEKPEPDWTFVEAPKWEYEKASIETFQKGGSVNLIPEGALHARKHEIDMENITKKGIPVISESEEGKVQQHAEIERDEIILRLEVTEQIEKAKKEYYSEDTKQSEKDKIAIEIGKLLVDEILYNTQDNTNLINQIN